MDKSEPIAEVLAPESYHRGCTACRAEAVARVAVGYDDGRGATTTSIHLCREHADIIALKLSDKQWCAVCGPVPVCDDCKGDSKPTKEKP